MSAWNDLLTQLVYPAVALSLPPIILIGFTWIEKHLGMTAAAAQDASARAAVQGAVATFAGEVLGDVAAGKVMLANVRNGQVGKALVDYAASTVGESMTRLAVTPQTLSAMLVGRVDALVAPALVAAQSRSDAPDVVPVPAMARAPLPQP